jgi:hypothetical protein
MLLTQSHTRNILNNDYMKQRPPGSMHLSRLMDH